MASSDFANAVRDYWAALRLDNEPPTGGESELDTFVDLLHASRNAVLGFELLGLNRDPYPGLWVNDNEFPWSLHWAIGLAEMEPFTPKGEADTIFLVDTIPAADGEHRVYCVQETVRGSTEFASLAQALRWMTAQVQLLNGEIDAEQAQAVEAAETTVFDDEWEQGVSSGMFLVEELLESPLLQAFEAISHGQWPVAIDVSDEPPKGKGPGWQRRLVHWLTLSFVDARHVLVPFDVDLVEFASAQRDLVQQLEDFEGAIHLGQVPSGVEAVVNGSNKRLAKLAKQWVADYRAWQKSVEADGDADDFEDDFEGDNEMSDAPNDDEAPVTTRRRRVVSGDTAGASGTASTPAKAKAKTKSKAPAKKKAPASAMSSDKGTAALLAAVLGGDLGDGEPEPPQEFQHTPFTRKLMEALNVSLDAMVAKGDLEFDPDRKDALVIELVEAASSARSASHMLKKLVNTLVDSDHVEEVYISDDELTDRIRIELSQN